MIMSLFGWPQSAGWPAFFFPAEAVFFSHKKSLATVFSSYYRVKLMPAEQALYLRHEGTIMFS